MAKRSFGKLQALPKFGQPITSSKWANLDEAFFEVAEGIRNAIDKTVTMATIPPHKYKKKFARDMKEISNDVLPAQRAFSTRSMIRMCPRCIEEFYPGDCQIVSQVTKQILMPSPTEWLAKQYAEGTQFLCQLLIMYTASMSSMPLLRIFLAL